MEIVKRRNVSVLALVGMALMMGVFCGWEASETESKLLKEKLE